MAMIKALVQTTLDDALYSKGIYTHDQRRTGADADQYVVFSQSGDTRTDYADDVNLVRGAMITVKYYYRSEYLDNHNTKRHVRTIEQEIESTLEAAGFTIPNGKFDAGDIEDSGFFVTVFECEYWRVA